MFAWLQKLRNSGHMYHHEIFYFALEQRAILRCEVYADIFRKNVLPFNRKTTYRWIARISLR